MPRHSLHVLGSLLVAACCPLGWGGEFSVDDSAGLGPRFAGVGAISGGGATSKLLADYPDSALSDVLDLLFKPKFGASLHWLKVEIGGDGDATEGSEPSHMRFPGDLNFQRGYEWMMMTGAKRRNPHVILHALPWTWPGFLNPQPKCLGQPWKNISLAVNYTLAWLKGAKEVHGLDVEYIGNWNEKPQNATYPLLLQQAIEAAGLKTRAGADGPHYPGSNNTVPMNGCPAEVYDSMDIPHYVDEEGSAAGVQSARCLARVQNRHYVSGCYVGMLQWHLASAFYSYSSWPRCGLLVAQEPWSGSYEVTPPLWAVAHTTQFVQPGWRFLKHGHGVGFLACGGSYVSYTDGSDLTIVVEKMNPVDSKCARGQNPEENTTDEKVIFELGGKWQGIRSMNAWRSDFSSASPPDSDIFQQLAALPVASGQVTIHMAVNTVVTLTTTSGQKKGAPIIPPPKPFPLPYSDDFEAKQIHQNGKYFYDTIGSWEVQETGDPRHGKALRQMTPVCPLRWWTVFYATPAFSFFGPADLVVDTASIDFRLESEGGFYFGPRNGPVVRLSSGGRWDYYKGHPNLQKPSVASGRALVAVSSWHTLHLDGSAKTATVVSLDGEALATLPTPMHPGGMTIGLDDWFHCWVDNLKLYREDAGAAILFE